MAAQKTWFKGNLHTHTTNSDGDTAPEHVAEWYLENGYDWLCLTDHNHLTILDDVDGSSSKWPMLVPGEEVTSRIGPDGAVPVHVNGFGISRLVEEAVEGTVVHALQHNVDAIRAAGGMASVNHPNYKWSIGADELLAVDGYRFMEIYNGHPDSNNEGGGGLPSTYNIWDRLLTAGRQVWGIAVDDSHHFQKEFGPGRSNPGRGWVQVRTDKLAVDGVLQALDDGNFYASTGVTLADLRSTPGEIAIEIATVSEDKYTTVFTGQRGTELYVSDSLNPRYRPSRLDGYVRATVYSSRGTKAWTQPVFMPER